MISQFFILSPRGDTIILRDYLKNTPKARWMLRAAIALNAADPVTGCDERNQACEMHRTQDSTEIFFRNVRFWSGGGDAPPVFLVDGVSYLHVKARPCGNRTALLTPQPHAAHAFRDLIDSMME